MRVIAGAFRSRSLQAPEGLGTRPTSDRLRETLFNVLAPRMEGARFLDLYAGSGAVGIEALSRGAAEVVFVERAAAALKVLRANLARLEVARGFRIVGGSVAGFLRKVDAQAGFDVIFLDPPYDAAREYETVLEALGGRADRLLVGGGVVVAEHRRKDKLEDGYGALKRTRLLQQGDGALSFYARNESAVEPADQEMERGGRNPGNCDLFGEVREEMQPRTLRFAVRSNAPAGLLV
jgi:16S rRNA (guanine966-N2)-methyltransferase